MSGWGQTFEFTLSDELMDVLRKEIPDAFDEKGELKYSIDVTDFFMSRFFPEDYVDWGKVWESICHTDNKTETTNGTLFDQEKAKTP